MKLHLECRSRQIPGYLHLDDFAQAYIQHMDKEHGVLISLNVEYQRPAS
jgi:hypothetical protein